MKTPADFGGMNSEAYRRLNPQVKIPVFMAVYLTQSRVRGRQATQSLEGSLSAVSNRMSTSESVVSRSINLTRFSLFQMQVLHSFVSFCKMFFEFSGF